MHLNYVFISEILIIGTGRYIQPVDPEIRKFIRSTGMKLEAVDSVRSVNTLSFLYFATFLILNATGH